MNEQLICLQMLSRGSTATDLRQILFQLLLQFISEYNSEGIIIGIRLQSCHKK